jgi:hypothetical protein
MNEASITQYITDTFDGVNPVDAWGDTFFFYNPDNVQPDEIYFATLKSKDDDYDRASNLNRPSTFRLNISLSKATFPHLFDSRPSRPSAEGAVDPNVDLSPAPRLQRRLWATTFSHRRRAVHGTRLPLPCCRREI